MTPEPQAYAYGPDLIPTSPDAAEGIWRWRRLLPLDGSGVYPLQVGGTPLVASPGLRRHLGVPGLHLKDETRTPTGSNKDRATALCLADAARQGVASIDVGFPMRYSHSSLEVCDLGDLDRLTTLLVEAIRSIDSGFSLNRDDYE